MNFGRQSGNFQYEEDPFAKKSWSQKNYQEVLLITKLLQAKTQVSSMNINYYELYYTVIKNRNAEEEED